MQADFKDFVPIIRNIKPVIANDVILLTRYLTSGFKVKSRQPLCRGAKKSSKMGSGVMERKISIKTA